MSRKIPAAVTLLTLSCGLLLLAGPYSGAGPAAASTMPDLATSPIKHVVIIYQENHAFDDVLGAVCQQRTTPCNGFTGPVTFADGVTAENIHEPDIVPDIKHSPDSQAAALSNQWDQIAGCRQAPYPCITHFVPSDIPNLTALADTYAVSDATFAVGRSASFGAHVMLAAGTIDGFAGFNPRPSMVGTKLGPGWGCPSYRDALWGPEGSQTMQPSCVPDQAGRGPYRKSLVPYVPTIMQRLEEAGRTWHIYEGPFADSEDTQWSVCTYFFWCYHNRQSLDTSDADFLAAAANGTLPNVSLLLPTKVTAQHNLNSMAMGDNYIGRMVAAIEKSPQWNSTVVFITYDDCGCFYDHVTPPDGLGLRNPMVIVSPWARPDSTDSTTAIQPYSMLAFIQHTFGLRSLTQDVDDSYDYAGSFDFSQRPVAPAAMTHTPISRSTRAEVRRLLPEIEDDPT
jgi:phospholipase C